MGIYPKPTFDPGTTGQFQVLAPIGPFATGTLYPTHIDLMGQGGYMAVPALSDMYEIPYFRRKLGMAVYVTAESRLYILTTDPAPGGDLNGASNTVTTAPDWTVFEPGGGGIEITDGTTTIPTADEIDFTGDIFTLTTPVSGSKAEVEAKYNTNINPATAVATSESYLQSLTAADFVGLDIVAVFNKILFPTQNPVYFPPTSSLVDSVSTIVEIGSSVSNNLTLSLIKKDSGGIDTGTLANITSSESGSLTLSPLSTTPQTNLNPQFGYANANNPNEKYTYTATDTFTMPASGTVNYTSAISWLVGNQLKDSTGTDSGTPIAAGTGNPSNSVSGIYPWFYFYDPNPITVANMQTAISNGSATKQVSSSTGTIDVPFIVTGEYIAVAYPATSTSKTKFFVNQTNQGNITVIFDPLGADVPVTESGGLWSNIDYKIHVSKLPQTSTATPLELRNN